MNPIARNILAAVCGVAAGSIVNMGLVSVGQSVVPLPEGADVSTMEGVRESMKLFTPVNFIFPFLAHALGTLAGAFAAAKLAAGHPMKFALGIGIFFLLGGLAAAAMLGGPPWFIATDLVLAYIPTAYIAATLARGKKVGHASA